MTAPPDQKSERAALAGSPVSRNHIPCTADSNEPVREFQAASLRRRFAIGYYFATVVATLAYGVVR